MAIITLYTDDIAAKYESLKDSIQTSFDNKFSEAEWYCPMTYEGRRRENKNEEINRRTPN